MTQPQEASQPPAGSPSAPAGGGSGFARANHRLRTLGLALGFLSLALPVHAAGASAWVWVALVLHGFVWPHVAYALSIRRPGLSRRSECRHLLVDHVAGGAWIAAAGFNMLPSVLMLTMMVMDSLICGGRPQAVRGIAAHAAGIGAGVLLLGLHWAPVSTPLQVLACLPLLFVHPVAVGAMAHRALGLLGRQRAELQELSQRDALSGLYNRRHWDERVREEHARHARGGAVASLVLIDLDHFKQINDDHGHAAGDEAIRRFARLLAQSVRSVDVACRYGGEEFGLLLPGTAPDAAAQAMRRLRERLREAPLVDGALVTASFGVVGISAEIDDAAAWLRLTDQMLYRAKHEGRDRVVAAGDAPPPGRPAHAAVPADLRTVARVLSGLAQQSAALALFDPSDRLAWNNAAFEQLYPVPYAGASFGDVLRHGHACRVGPRIETDDIEAWLRSADAKRRSKPRRRFAVDMLDGRWLRVEEVSFDDGWLLGVFTELDGPPPPSSSAGRPGPSAPMPLAANG